MGMIFTMPLPQILATTMMAMATRASHQQVAAFLMAEPERFRPIMMIMGPVTMGGKYRMTVLAPSTLKSRASTRYRRPAMTMPPRA